ncbi:MAG: GntR family transcriptional regulator YhfZ [Lawsonibacter sp.]
MYDQQFLSKQGEVTIQLAKMFLKMKEGDRLPSNQKLSKNLNAGIGTIQSALRYFEENGHVNLTSHGHQGTVIDKINYVKLFKCNSTPWILGAMPLPYSHILEGLATGLYRNFERYELLLKMSYIRGSMVRISRLLNGNVDFVICSDMAANIALKKYPQLEIVFKFGVNSYVGRSGIIFSDKNHKEIVDHMKIGIDEDSFDHVYLNQIIGKGHKVEFIKLKYTEIFTKLKNREIDATIWSFNKIEDTGLENCVFIPTDESLVSAMASAQEAVIVVKKDSYVNNVIRSIIDAEKIKQIQGKVIGRELIPSY